MPRELLDKVYIYCNQVCDHTSSKQNFLSVRISIRIRKQCVNQYLNQLRGDFD